MMRLSSLAVAIAAFVIAALLSVIAARSVVALVEDRSVVAVQERLIDRGHDWVRVLGDGLQVILEGEAPSEVVRFRALSVAGTIVDASRVIDNMTVTEAEGFAPPQFAMEILRNDEGISLIGLIPEATDRAALDARIAEIAGDLPVADFLESADYPVPDGWRRSVTLALRALAALERSKISVAPGRVTVTAIADSIEDQRRFESDFARGVPEGVRLDLTINAPRPVIAPFILRFVIDGDGARFDACAADTEVAQRRIIAAARAAGVTGTISCPLGLGVPSNRWGEASALAIAALAELEGGTLTFSDADVSLIAAEGTDPDRFDRVAGELANALPDAFVLEAVLPTASQLSEGPPQFSATLSPEGQLQLRGRVPDEIINTTVENFARARFGAGSVRMGTRIAADLPAGWAVRILAGLEALSHLSNGALVVEPDRVSIRGNTGSPEAEAAITRLMIEKLGRDARVEIAVTYVEALDPIAGLPSPEECVAQIEAVTRDRKILFDPGSTTLAAEAQPVLDDIAEILRRCPDLRIEVAGYTDSQGSEGGNLRISQERADSVLAALRARRVPVARFEAVGYGEADPIADNATEEGREANRRIEFRLIRPEGAGEEPTTLEEVEAPADEAEAEDTGSE